jgi:hypothetical protein
VKLLEIMTFWWKWWILVEMMILVEMDGFDEHHDFLWSGEILWNGMDLLILAILHENDEIHGFHEK